MTTTAKAARPTPGSGAAPAPAPGTPGGVPDYAAMHRRLRALRGPAKGQQCAGCGAVARCWCYDGTDPDEQRDPASGRRYSVDPGRYWPRCASCHRTIAAGHAPLTPDVIEQAAAFYEGGAGVAQTAARFGVTRPALRAALTTRGVVPRRRAAVVDVEQAAALYGTGASIRAVAVRLGVPRHALREALAARGVDIRPRRAVLDTDRACALYEAGESLARIASVLGVSRLAVRAALTARGVVIRAPRTRAGSNVDGNRAAALYAAGAGLRGIAAQLGVTRPAVRTALTARGVAIRPPGPTRRHLPRPVAPTAGPNRVTFQPFPTTSRQPSPSTST